MKINSVLIILILISSLTFATPFQWHFPLSNSTHIPVGANILVRVGYNIEDEQLAKFKNCSIVGIKSGRHKYTVSVSTDRKVVILHPDTNFEYEEQVIIHFPKIYFGDSYDISFRTAKYNRITEHPSETTVSRNPEDYPDFPPLKITKLGSVFNAPLIFSGGTITNTSYRFGLLDTVAYPLQAVKIAGIYTHLQPINDSTYSVTKKVGFSSIHYFLNKNLEKIDSIVSPEGYELDFHDMKILPNGNFLVLTEDPFTVDMSQVVQGGSTNATLYMNSILELDKVSKEPVNIWRTFDHFTITDWKHGNYESTASLLSPVLFLTHCNSIQQTDAGEWLLSSRNFDNITLINPLTGNIKWQIGGASNQFTFVNDPYNGFNFQHHATLLPNRTLLLFDNGPYHTPQVARAVEYQLNEQNMTATLTRSYVQPQGYFSVAGGSYTILPNHNRLISWGNLFYSHDRALIFCSEADSLGNYVAHIQMDTTLMEDTDTLSCYLYRVYKPNSDLLSSSITTPALTDGHVTAFPNPTSQQFRIKIPTTWTDEPLILVEFFNSEGMLLKQEQVHPLLIDNTSFELSNVPNGIYLLRISTPNKSYISKIQIQTP